MFGLNRLRNYRMDLKKYITIRKLFRIHSNLTKKGLLDVFISIQSVFVPSALTTHTNGISCEKESSKLIPLHYKHKIGFSIHRGVQFHSLLLYNIRVTLSNFGL